MESVNSLINDRTNRRKTEAETDLIRIQSKKEEAEIERIKAETEKINVETQLMRRELSAPNLKTNENAILNIQIECDSIIRESLAAGFVCEIQSSEDKVG